MLGCWWWTAVSRDVVEDGSEFVDNAVALCKKSSLPQRDPGTCRESSERRRKFEVIDLC